MKKELRLRLIKKRKALSDHEREEKSKGILRCLELLPEIKKSKSVLCYVSIREEVSTREFIEKNINTKKIIVPVMIDNQIVPCILSSVNELSPGKFGIPEPINKNRYNGEIDCILVPGIGFDMEGYRIGYGYGHYDIFLRNRKGIKIGLCFEAQLQKKFPHEQHDIPMNIIITQKRVIRVQKNI